MVASSLRGTSNSRNTRFGTTYRLGFMQCTTIAILNREIVAAIRVRDSDIVAYQVSEVQLSDLNFHFVIN